jgi:hypothetical protein
LAQKRSAGNAGRFFLKEANQELWNRGKGISELEGKGRRAAID